MKRCIKRTEQWCQKFSDWKI